MPTSSPNPTEQAAVPAFAERCAQLGLAAWRREPGGAWVLFAPALAEGCREWLGTPAIAELVRASAANPVTPCPEGAGWIVRADGRERTNWRVLALAPEALASGVGRRACEQSGLSVEAARAALGPMLRHDRRSADLLAPVLKQALHDLSTIEEQRDSLDGFTRQLTDSYETVNLLYAIGREMDDPTRPERFARFVCERVAETSGLGWVGVGFMAAGAGAELLPPSLKGRVVTAPGEASWFARWHGALEGMVSAGSGCQILGPEWLPGDVPGTPATGETPPGACPSESVVMPVVVDGHLVGVLAGGGKPATAAGGALSSYDTQMIEAAGRYLSALVRSSCLYAAQQAMFVGTVRAMTAAIDAKDHYTRGHSERVAMLARRLALATGADEAEADAVHIAGLLHDVGKIGVPEAVLCKQGRLTDEEFAFIRAHPEIGVRILRDIPALAGAMPGVLHHHERYDGTGYPTGLAGEAIPRVARLLAVADAFDAMSSTRSYRPAMPRERVLEQVRKGAGSQFDPTIAQAMLGVDLTDYDAMVRAAGAGHPSEAQTPPSRAA